MSLGKKDIVKNISSKTHVNLDTSSKLLNKFLELVVIKSKKNIIKISNFGVFYIHQSPIRMGRNPITKEVFQIPKIRKVVFKASNKIKDLIN
jgi:nucleoid DNA-binding protein